MKKFIMGLVTGLTISTTVVFGSNMIKSAEYNTSKIIFDGVELDTSGQPMVSIQEEGSSGVKNYMPVRSVLEQMGYNVQWDGVNNTVIIKSSTVDKDTVVNSNNTMVETSKTITYSVDENVSFTDNSEIKVLNTYTTDTVTADGSIFSADNGHLFFGIELEVLVRSTPQSDSFWYPNQFILEIKSNDGKKFEQPMSFGSNEIYPNEKTVKTVYISIPENADITEILLTNGTVEQATVKIK